jgi:hypothetical protein
MTKYDNTRSFVCADHSSGWEWWRPSGCLWDVPRWARSAAASTSPKTISSTNCRKKPRPVALAERFLKDPRRAWVIEEANPGATFQKGKTVIIPLKDDNRAGLVP